MVSWETDFSHLKRTIFDRSVFWPAVWRGCAVREVSNQETLHLVTLVLGKLNPGECLAWHSLGFEVKRVPWRKHRTWKYTKRLTPAGLRKLGFKEIRENQRMVVDGYVRGWDTLMTASKGSGKSLTFHIASFENIQQQKRPAIIMFGWTFLLTSVGE